LDGFEYSRSDCADPKSGQTTDITKEKGGWFIDEESRKGMSSRASKKPDEMPLISCSRGLFS